MSALQHRPSPPWAVLPPRGGLPAPSRLLSPDKVSQALKLAEQVQGNLWRQSAASLAAGRRAGGGRPAPPPRRDLVLTAHEHFAYSPLFDQCLAGLLASLPLPEGECGPT